MSDQFWNRGDGYEKDTRTGLDNENIAGATDEEQTRVKSNNLVARTEGIDHLKNTIEQTGIDTGNVIIKFETDQKFAKPNVTVNENATADQIKNAVNNAIFALIKLREGMEAVNVPRAPAMENVGLDDKIEEDPFEGSAINGVIPPE